MSTTSLTSAYCATFEIRSSERFGVSRTIERCAYRTRDLQRLKTDCADAQADRSHFRSHVRRNIQIHKVKQATEGE